ncbi:hypothetical protein H0Z60_16995 [Ectothiorhodospiraceae bacterium WFHF3C12]|nr:hypothetical protein [Ectothiorhodospiraceae bacterium WFHF3C12]
MTTALGIDVGAEGGVLYKAVELSLARWKLAFSDGERRRERTIEAGDLAALAEEVDWAKPQSTFGDCRLTLATAAAAIPAAFLAFTFSEPANAP